MKTLTITVEDKVKEGLDKIAKATAKSSSYVAEELIKTFLDFNDWQIKAIESSVERAGFSDAKFVDNEEVTQWLQSWGTDFEVEPPLCK